jgi:inorganic pyrophosphatase
MYCRRAQLYHRKDMHSEESRLFEVTIEIPRWGFIKRGGNDVVDFISPLPCPYNYGAIPEYVGLDGDLLDAVVLGRRLSRGTTLETRVYGAIGLTDHGDYDDKLICSDKPLSAAERFLVLNFFRLYATFKKLLNVARHRRGPTFCSGWRDVNGALARARSR